MKVVINKCFGGFGLSDKALEMLGLDDDWRIDRKDEKLVEVVEALGEEANGDYASLMVVEIPKEATDWRIEEYDGSEYIIAVVDGKLVDLGFEDDDD